jgi:murein DD-endopeptidase MepM/ murein hydrolase activator NlpD
MARKKYHFNPDQLTLTPVKRSLKRWLIRATSYILFSLIIGTAGFFLTTGLVKTPREKNLISQNEKLLELFISLDKRLNAYDRTLSAMVNLDDSIYRSLVGKNPLPWSLREAGTGGHSPNISLSEAGYPAEVIEIAERIDRLDAHLKIQENSYKEVLKEAFRTRTRLNHMPAIMPIYNEDLKMTGSGFGMRMHPILNIYRMHEGIDFFASTGTPVFATADGVVKDVRVSETFGKVIEIDHGYGLVTLYAHLSSFKVKKGQAVKRGNIIGEVGNTGLSSGEHLHYEVHVNGNEVDPVNYFFNDLSPAEYRKVVAIAQAYERSMD